MKGRGWIALAVMVLLVFVLVLLRGTGTQGRSPDHASTSDAGDGTSALRAYADALGHSSGSVEGDFALSPSSGLLFVFTPTTGFSSGEVQQLNSWMQSGGVLVYAAEDGDPQLDAQFGLRRSPTAVPAKAHAARSQPGAPTSLEDSADVMKIPDPIIEPTTIIVASSRLKRLSRCFCESFATSVVVAAASVVIVVSLSRRRTGGASLYARARGVKARAGT